MIKFEAWLGDTIDEVSGMLVFLAISAPLMVWTGIRFIMSRK